jgi:hypothetical protein
MSILDFNHNVGSQIQEEDSLIGSPGTLREKLSGTCRTEREKQAAGLPTERVNSPIGEAVGYAWQGCGLSLNRNIDVRLGCREIVIKRDFI